MSKKEDTVTDKIFVNNNYPNDEINKIWFKKNDSTYSLNDNSNNFYQNFDLSIKNLNYSLSIDKTCSYTVYTLPAKNTIYFYSNNDEGLYSDCSYLSKEFITTLFLLLRDAFNKSTNLNLSHDEFAKLLKEHSYYSIRCKVGQYKFDFNVDEIPKP